MSVKSVLPQALYALLRDLYLFLRLLKKQVVYFFVGLTVRKNQDVRFSWNRDSGRKFVVNQRWDDPYVRQKFLGGFDCYETYRRAVETFASQAPVIFDIGANIGMSTLVFAEVTNSSVYSFEPVKRTFSYLQKNLAENGLDNIKIFNFGFDETASTKLIGSIGESASGVFHILPALKEETQEGVYSEEATFKALDQFVQDENIAGVDYLKIDAEGYDIQILKGGAQTILDLKPVIQFEIAKPPYFELYDIPWLKDFMGRLGKTDLFHIYDDKLIEIDSFDQFLEQDVIQTDIIIVPR